MNRLLLIPTVSLLLQAACRSSPPDRAPVESAMTDADTSPTSDTRGTADLASVASKVISQSAGVSKDEVVQLGGSPDDLQLLEELALEARKLGAHPIVTVESERFRRRSYDEVPAALDSQRPLANLGLTQMTDVIIYTESSEGGTTKDVPPERMAARAKAFRPVMELARKRNVRLVGLGNGLYPTNERVEQLGLDRGSLLRVMLTGINTDYDALRATGERLRRALARGKVLQVTGPSGTDLTLRIQGRPVHVSDGVISPEERKRGGAALFVWLPAGEVYLTAVPGSAEGMIVADRYFYGGEVIEGLRLTVKGGKLTDMTAPTGSGLEALRARYAAAGGVRDAVGIVDIGINPDIRLPEGTPVNVWSRAGAVTISIGDDQWAGGTNVSDFAVSPEVGSATVTVDGTPLVEDGTLVPQATASR